VSRSTQLVIVGLVPAIPESRADPPLVAQPDPTAAVANMDRRVKPGDDGKRVDCRRHRRVLRMLLY